MRAKVHAAGTTLLLALCLCAAVLSPDPGPAAAKGVPAMTSMDTASLPSGPRHHVAPRLVVETVIPAGRVGIHVPILEYHYIRDYPKYPDVLGYNLSVSVADFKAQMNWLAAHDYHPVTFDDLRAYFTQGKPIASKPVVLTFDDGYLDFYKTAFPILESHGFKAVSYVVSGFVGLKRYMTIDMIRELDRNGIEIASHTVSHVNLAATSPPLVAYQVTASKHWLETLLGHPVVDFCYPSGRFSNSVIQALQHAGYSTATTEMDGTLHTWSTRFVWPRTRVSGGEVLATFVFDMGPFDPYIRIKTTVV